MDTLNLILARRLLALSRTLSNIHVYAGTFNSYFKGTSDILDGIHSAKPKSEHIRTFKADADSFYLSNLQIKMIPDESSYSSSSGLSSLFFSEIEDELQQEREAEGQDSVDTSADWTVNISGKKISLSDAEAYDDSKLPPINKSDVYVPFKVSIDVDGTTMLEDIYNKLPEKEKWLHVITSVSGKENTVSEMKFLHGKNVRWAHRGLPVVWVPTEKIELTELNSWDFSHAAGVLQAMKDGEVVEVPVARVYKITEKDVEDTEKYQENNELSYQTRMVRPWRLQDVGSYHAQLLDGNHRAAAAMILGEDSIPVYVGKAYVENVDEKDFVK